MYLFIYFRNMLIHFLIEMDVFLCAVLNLSELIANARNV